MMSANVMDQILDLARWAPSGDNTQPWRFEVIDDLHFVIHGRDTRSNCVYDLDGHPSQLSLGALIETAAIAASSHGLALFAQRRMAMPENLPTFDVELTVRHGLMTDPLVAAIPLRSVQRRPLKIRRLTESAIAILEASVGPDHSIRWFGGWSARWRWARLLWRNAGLRLTMPEAFDVHRRVIQWGARYSADRIPDQALGADALTLALMRWAMVSWQRVTFLNRWLGGTIAPRLTMDLLPAMACAAHVAIVARRAPASTDHYVAAGRAVQRFWLTAASLGIQHQPEMTPVIFSRYVRTGLMFSANASTNVRASALAMRFDRLLGGDADHVVWLGRLGHGPLASSRSVRSRR